MPMDTQRWRRHGWHIIGVAAWLTALSIALNAIAGAAWWSWLLNGVAVGGVVTAVVLRGVERRHRRRADELHRERLADAYGRAA